MSKLRLSSSLSPLTSLISFDLGAQIEAEDF